MKHLIFPALLLTYVTSVAAEGLMDPTRPPLPRTAVKAVASEPVLRLEAIMRTDERMVAIVNGKLVRAGDRIGQATIQSIETDRVRYVSGGRTHEIRLPSASMKVRRDRSEDPQ